MSSTMAMTREQIVSAALDILQTDGLDGLSLRRLATKLHIKAASLYWHVKNKRDLLDELAEEMLRKKFAVMPEPKPGQTWQDWLLSVAQDLRAALLAYRDGGLVISGVNPRRAHTYARLSAHVLTTLHETYRIDIPTAGIAFTTVFIYTVGAVVEEQTSPSVAELRDDGPAMATYLSRSMLDALEVAMAEEGTIEDFFEASIRFMLGGSIRG